MLAPSFSSLMADPKLKCVYVSSSIKRHCLLSYYSNPLFSCVSSLHSYYHISSYTYHASHYKSLSPKNIDLNFNKATNSKSIYKVEAAKKLICLLFRVNWELDIVMLLMKCSFCYCCLPACLLACLFSPYSQAKTWIMSIHFSRLLSHMVWKSSICNNARRTFPL